VTPNSLKEDLMIHGDTKKDAHLDDDEDEMKPAKPIVLGELKTDEEARLAREIEKLRGQGREGDDDV
jgi:hypothetical protein